LRRYGTGTDWHPAFMPGVPVLAGGAPVHVQVGRCRFTVSKPVLKPNRQWFQRLKL
jgi:hypothetical protein